MHSLNGIVSWTRPIVYINHIGSGFHPEADDGQRFQDHHPPWPGEMWNGVNTQKTRNPGGYPEPGLFCIELQGNIVSGVSVWKPGVTVTTIILPLKQTILGGFDVSAIRQKSPFLDVFSHGCSTVKISIAALHKNVSPNLIMFLLIITASGPCRTDQPDCPQWQQLLFTASSQLLHSTVISQNFP